MLTHSDDASNQGFTGSDFLLVEVEDPINASWNPFYAGFDATTFGGAEGVGIHHPAGDRKKISYYDTNLISQSIGASGSHWRVTWQPTERPRCNRRRFFRLTDFQPKPPHRWHT